MVLSYDVHSRNEAMFGKNCPFYPISKQVKIKRDSEFMPQSGEFPQKKQKKRAVNQCT